MPTEPLQSLPDGAKVLGVKKSNSAPMQSLPSGAEILNVNTPKSKYVTDASGHIDDFNPLGKKKDDNLEPILNEIVRTSAIGISDSEKDMLRDILKNPNTTPEQAKEAIQTIQGYHPKQKNNTITSPEYYIRKAENGVVMPVPLGQGEKPPKGYNVANVWGQTKKDAEDDGYLTDLGKSLFNALPALSSSVADVGNFISTAVTGEDSEFFNRMGNFSESLKLNKNERGGKTLYNPSDAESFGELFSADRFDLSKESLWNTFNWAAESLPQFLLGAAEAKAVLTGGKAAINAVRGVKGAAELGKLGNTASVFGSSFAMQIGENMQAAKEAGLEGRDVAKVAGSISTVQALLDAYTGLDLGAKLFNPEIKAASSELLKKFASQAAVGADGRITKEAMKKLGQEYALEYSKMANSFVKQGLKGTGEEMGQEVLQEITKKAGEQIWDNMSDEDKAKFGTDALSARSFGDYLSAGINSLGVAPISMLTAEKQKQRYKDQSLNAYEVVQGGKDKIDEFKANVYNEFRKGNLTESERDQAVFKIDAYDKYAKQVADFPKMSDEDKKNAFELSFNIEALQKEIDIPKEDLDKLDPIAIAKIDTKKTLISGLQKELNHILLKQDVQRETKVGQDTINKVEKQEGLEPKSDKEGNKQPTSLEELAKKLEEKPIVKKVRPKIEEVTNAQWVKDSEHHPEKIKGILQEHLKTTPRNEMEVTIHSAKNRRYSFLVGEGKPVRFGQSVEGAEGSKTPDYFKRENLPATKIFIEDKGGDTNEENQGEPEHYFQEKAIVKRVEFKGENRKGKTITKAVLPVYNAQTGKFIGFAKENKLGRSYYPTREEQSHLRHIINSNLYDGSLNGYEHGAAQPAKVPNYEYQSVEEFVDDYVGGKLQGTPEEEQFYINNAAEIEAKLKELIEADKQEAEAKIDANRKEYKIPEKFFQGKRVEYVEGMSEEEYIDAVLRDSENPAQIAEAWLMSPKNEQVDAINQFGAAGVYEGIYNFFKDGNTISKKAFERIADKNHLNRKDIPAYDRYFSDNGVSADSLEMRQYGEKITPQDVADFINSYPNGHGGYAANFKTSKRFKLSEKFESVAGRTLTESFAKKLALEDNNRNEALAQDEEMAAMDAQYERELENEAERNRVFAETGQLQKQAARKADFAKVVDRIKKVMPKVKVVIDDTINAAGKVEGNTLSINPDYAGLDTPIHEAGHILIDAIGYKNKAIQKAISQLKDTPLWKETVERYPELNEEMLGKEVLAEAIGREGADIFDNQVAKSKFKAILDYIFDKLKTLLGINRNVAKSLAKQIISGIGTKGLQGAEATVQEQKPKKPLTPEELAAKNIMDDLAERGMSEVPYEDLVDIYNAISSADIRKKGTYQTELERRIALNLKERGLENSQKQVDEGILKHKDIGWFDKWFKVLSWFDEKFPEMKELSKMWNAAYFNKMKEARAEKNTHDKLAEAVVSERNKKLGIIERGKSYLANRAYKSFEYLDNGKGQLITLDEAKAKGLSEAQINYLKYVRTLLAKRQELDVDSDVYSVDMDVIKLDKGFSEAFNSDGFVAAVGSFFSNNNDLLATKIPFTNPNTGREQMVTFGDIQKILTTYGEKGVKEKAKAALLMVRYGHKAKRQLKYDKDSGVVDKTKAKRIIVDEKGELLSRFGGERIKGRAYSKDFYNAVSQYIDDSAHIKHISPLVPVINSIEYLVKEGAFEGKEVLSQRKDNLSEWMDDWIKQHVLRKPKESDPALDTMLKTLRFATSGIAMWFRVSANLMNVAIGNYNNWRQENGATWAKGQKRLFGNLKYSAAILDKYVAVSNDIDSNPFMGAKDKLASLGYLGQKYGEWQIQGSGLLGLMSDEDYNSFEFKKNQYGVDELVIKDSLSDEQKNALEARILALIDRVSDVQGKYSAKDRMNIMNNELGKAVMQFHVWIPAWVHSRFGDEGSYKIAYRNLVKDGLKDLRNELKSEGFIKTYKTNKAFAQNLRGAMAIGLLMTLAYQDDDDKEKSETAAVAQKMLHDILFIFDPENLKYTVTHPIAVTGTIEKFINAFEHLIYLEEYKGDSKYGDKGDLKIQGDLLSVTPAGNLIDAVDMVNGEEE